MTVEEPDGRRSRIGAEAVLVAVGRKGNVGGLGLEAAGVEYSHTGIKADKRLRTTAGNIYACGDVAGPYQFSHMAEYQARIAARNALLPLTQAADYRNYIWCTFADPEFAHAGLTEDEARERTGGRVKVFRWRYGDTDRAKTEADEFGVAKFICDRSYRLLGAHILGPRAGELIHEAKSSRLSASLSISSTRLSTSIRPFPMSSNSRRK